MKNQTKKPHSKEILPAGLFVGLAGIDLVYQVDELPKEDNKTKTNKYEIRFGGPAFLAAKTYVSLGGKATLVSCVGHSVLAELIHQECSQLGIILRDLTPHASMPNISSVFLNPRNGTRTICSGQNPSRLLRLPTLGDFGFCLYDGNMPTVNKSLLSALEEECVPLILDCGSWKPGMEEILEFATTAISSETFRSPDGKDIFALGQEYGLFEMAMTRGKKHIIFMETGERKEIPVVAVEHADTLGAGDVFHGAFCFYRYNESLGLEDSLKKAAKVAHDFVSKRTIK